MPTIAWRVAALCLVGMAYAAKAQAVHQTVQVLGVSYTLPAGWKAKALGPVARHNAGGITVEGQDFSFTATPSPLLNGQPPLSATLRVLHILKGAAPFEECELNQEYMRSLQQETSDFKSLGNSVRSFPHLRGCVTEFVYKNKHLPTIPTMWGRILNAKEGKYLLGMVVVSADHKTAAGLRSHTLRFKEMDDFLRSVSVK